MVASGCACVYVKETRRERNCMTLFFQWAMGSTSTGHKPNRVLPFLRNSGLIIF